TMFVRYIPNLPNTRFKDTSGERKVMKQYRKVGLWYLAVGIPLAWRSRTMD
ncbi:hypothetical protein FRB99_003651, partial [Tulasnella sp. 403]